MKYIKKFEKNIHDVILYKCDKFNIVIDEFDGLTFNSNVISCSGLMAISTLIAEKSKYLSDIKLRNIKLRETDKIKEIKQLNLDEVSRRINIRQYISGAIRFFLDQNKSEMPRDVYMIMTEKYYPIIADAIEKSETIGDIIDKFTIIYNKLISDLELEMSANKYNL